MKTNKSLVRHPVPIKVLADKRSQQQINKKISEKFWRSARSEGCRQFSHSRQKNKQRKQTAGKVAIFHFYLTKTSLAQSRWTSCNCQSKTKANRNANTHTDLRDFTRTWFDFFFFQDIRFKQPQTREPETDRLASVLRSQRMAGPDKMASMSVAGSPFLCHSARRCQRWCSNDTSASSTLPHCYSGLNNGRLVVRARLIAPRQACVPLYWRLSGCGSDTNMI